MVSRWALIFVAGLAGCASAPVVRTYPPIDPAKVTISNVALADTTRVGGIEARLCQRTLLSPEPKSADAMKQLKEKAASLGADVIVGYSLASAGITVSPACINSLVATGSAYHTDK